MIVNISLRIDNLHHKAIYLFSIIKNFFESDIIEKSQKQI